MKFYSLLFTRPPRAISPKQRTTNNLNRFFMFASYKIVKVVIKIECKPQHFLRCTVYIIWLNKT